MVTDWVSKIWQGAAETCLYPSTADFVSSPSNNRIRLIDGTYWTTGLKRSSQSGSNAYAFSRVVSFCNSLVDGSLKITTSRVATGTGTATNSSYGIALGSGSTAPSSTDYWLSGSQITSNFSSSFPVNTITTDENNNPIKKIQMLITNTHATNSMTISELGVIGAVNTVTSASYIGDNPTVANNSVSFVLFLIDRVVLDTPVTLEAGDHVALTYIFGQQLYSE